MSHVDEGRIHAYLDGAYGPDDPERTAIETHIESCAACRAALEEERRLRDRATGVLGRMVPDAVRVEPFEEILARHSARGSGAGGAPPAGGPGAQRDAGAADARRPRRSFYIPATMAATLVIAVTATWFARAYLPRPATPISTEMLESAVDEVAPPAAGVAGPEPELATAGRDDRGAADRLQAAGEGAVGNVARPPVAQEEQARVAESKTTAAAPPVLPRAAVDPRRTAAETRQLANEMIDRPVELTDFDVAIAGGRLVAFAEVPDSVRSRGRRDEFADTEAGWVVVTLEEATRRLGRAPFVIEGLAADSVQLREVDGTPILRIAHQLPDGTPIELLQWPAGALQAPQAEAQAERREADVVTEREAPGEPGGSWRAYRWGVLDFLVRGRVSADSLAVLAGRVR